MHLLNIGQFIIHHLSLTFMEATIEAILFASGDALKAERIAAAIGLTLDEVFEAAERLGDSLAFEKRGIRLVRTDDSLQLITAQEYYEEVRRVLEVRRPPKLSPAALEVLAIVAFGQPVTRAQIDMIRGIDSGYTVGMLAERGLIEQTGRLEDMPGRPPTYGTTDVFLKSAGVTSLAELKQFKPQGSEQMTMGEDFDA
jgi:segregation and condensation protein B